MTFLEHFADLVKQPELLRDVTLQALDDPKFSDKSVISLPTDSGPDYRERYAAWLETLPIQEFVRLNAAEVLP